MENELDQLMRFYDVSTLEDLVREQEKHIARLQEANSRKSSDRSFGVIASKERVMWSDTFKLVAIVFAFCVAIAALIGLAAGWLLFG